MFEASGRADAPGGISNQLATLVPSFDPSKDDLQVYQQKSATCPVSVASKPDL